MRQARTIVVGRDVQALARQTADEFRRTMAGRGTFVVNLLSSPGAGKTTLLEATARRWSGSPSMAVLVGDLATDRDAVRLARYVPAVQLTTGGACHLELPLVERGLAQLPEARIDFLFIENIGNLVCPSSHDLGEHLRVIVLSATEGDDKPGKYPKAFRTSHAMVISKLDLLPHVPFSIDRAMDDARQIQPDLEIVTVASLRDEGVDAWGDLLKRHRREYLESRAASSCET